MIDLARPDDTYRRAAGWNMQTKTLCCFGSIESCIRASAGYRFASSGVYGDVLVGSAPLSPRGSAAWDAER